MYKNSQCRVDMFKIWNMDCVLSFFFAITKQSIHYCCFELNAKIAKLVVTNYGICLLISVSIVKLIGKHLFAKNDIQNGGTVASNTVMVNIFVVVVVVFVVLH